jgi:hypothetical protein
MAVRNSDRALLAGDFLVLGMQFQWFCPHSVDLSKGGVVKAVQAFTGCLALWLVPGASVSGQVYDFPLAGSYTQKTPCKGDGSDPSDLQVKISMQKIYSKAGICTFLNIKREGSTIRAQVECRFPNGPLVGDVTFSMQADHTINFTDRDKNYSSVLYRCPD